jgi:hypothetical protein
MTKWASKTAGIIAARDDALAFARERVRMVRDEGIEWAGVPLRWFNQDDTLRGWREIIKGAAVRDPKTMSDLTHYARAGWGLADDVLVELNAQYGHFRVDKPVLLEAYMLDRVEHGRPLRAQSSQPYSHFLRDIAIVCIVAEVCARFGMKPRRTSSSRPSGCAITAEALHIERISTIDVSAVEAVWSRLRKFAFPGGLRPLTAMLSAA